MSGEEEKPFFLSDKNSSKQSHLNRHTLFKILTVACVSIGLLLYGIGLMSKGPETPAGTERKETMFVTKQNPATNYGIPPIDVSAPANTETATFALG